MYGGLIEITLGNSGIGEGVSSNFNNDLDSDDTRNSFVDVMSGFEFSGNYFVSPKYYFLCSREKVPFKYLYGNVQSYSSSQIAKVGDKSIRVGEYCNHGVVVPRDYTVAFSDLYNCAPLISLVRGDEDYVSFLHTWANEDSDVVDRQVRHWMKVISRKGDVLETVFSPRKTNNTMLDTLYESAVLDIVAVSNKTIVLTRDIAELRGVVNGDGVYFQGCGYRLWES